MEQRTTPDEETVYVGTEAEKGSEAPFRVVYSDRAGERRWGFVCANCGSFSNAMDPMGRIVCNDCPNVRKPTEWDAAHE